MKKGAIFTEQHKHNLSLSHMGARPERRKALQISICLNCNIVFKHKNPPSRLRKYCSLKCQNKAFIISGQVREYPVRDQHPNWRGGTSEDRKLDIGRSEYRKWRKAVYERDNYTCQDCGIRGSKLNADHIKPWSLFPDLRYELSNGRTLCISCHKKTPTYGGKVFNYVV